MQYSLTLAALAAGTLTLAAPAADIPQTHTFSVPQVSSGKVFKSGALHTMKTYNKYAKIGAVAPDHVVKAAQAAAAQQGSVSANPEQYDESYLCPVSAGGKTLNLDFDTGSADLWVFSTDTPSSESSGHALYNGEATGTRLSGYTWDITYQDGSGSSGIVYTDKVVVGPVTATKQAVEAATSVSSAFSSDTDNDGLLGLAFSSINTVSPKAQKTFFDTVKSSLSKPLFAANLKKGTAGTYDFGYIDSSKYTGSLTYVNADSSQGFWGFTGGSYATGSGSYSGSIGSAIADTGTTLLYIPSAAVTSYYKKVSGAVNSDADGGYVFPCSATLPDWHVKIGSGTFTVPGSYINYAPTDSTGETCYGGIQSNTGIGLSIFGDIFLKAHYVVFDQTNGVSSPRLGFAKQA
ncbi:Aspartic protease SNP2 [Acrodontium crateriforme]|uniref:Aspartic protease SNP2 n=1 Tax=Acrodontium crateriforme TaxID=150365 RepID=A0AAQ3M4Y4_9PEZI|nr:Aspartic protease SNP2 [Acrodontium crateriforme]